MKMEFCRFRDFAVPLLGLSTRHPSIHEMRAIQLVDSSFRAPYLPDAAGARLCLGRTIYDLFGTESRGRADDLARKHRLQSIQNCSPLTIKGLRPSPNSNPLS